ncbi:DUF397 domain-containing protein [Saccharopolyspora ipomoeae]|uniref:DUF397 domain-containing protein n=1 Tax=Saccharopolyspora ipomoeae TaxID=3042027 RepID=UPI0031BB24D8
MTWRDCAKSSGRGRARMIGLIALLGGSAGGHGLPARVRGLRGTHEGVDVNARPEWRKSSRSNQGGNCVEVALNLESPRDPGLQARRGLTSPEGGTQGIPRLPSSRGLWRVRRLIAWSAFGEA